MAEQQGIVAVMSSTRHKRRRLSQDAGFSLIELLIAVFVFSLGMVAVLASMTGMARQQMSNDYESVSSTYMEFLLTDLQTNVYNSGVNVSVVTDYTTDDVYGNLFIAPAQLVLPGIERPVTVSMRRVDVGNLNPTEVEVTLTISGLSGHDYTRTTSRLIRWGVIL